VASGEVWRYDLESRVWNEEIFLGANIEDVFALAYDSNSDKLVLLSEIQPPNEPPSKARVELIVLDYRTHRAVVLGEWKQSKAFERVTLTARHDGTFVLLGSKANAELIKAYRFALTGDDSVEWTGHATIHGRLLDEPTLTNDGVVAPVVEKGAEVLLTLIDADFKPSSSDIGSF
jgi:hypothetical protein